VSRIAQKISQAAGLLGLEVQVEAQQIIVDDRWIGPSYGVPTPEGIEAMMLLARTEGIVLDPVYSGKGCSGLIGMIREGTLAPDKTAIFLHTGGAPAIFAMADELLPALIDGERQIRVVG